MDALPAIPGAPGVEVPRPIAPRPEIRSVIFDFDGTLSLIRQGWTDVMAALFLEAIPRLPDESADDLRRIVRDDIAELNGRQSLDQMARLADRVRDRGGAPLDPLDYKAEYLDRLGARVYGRTEGLEKGRIDRRELIVHGALPMLDHLRRLGLSMTLASGTDEPAVKTEAALLGIDEYFGDRIFGALDDPSKFSKRRVIDRIVAEGGGDPRALLAFGDGIVEIREAKAVGGLAVAVASVETANGSGRVEPWKRESLLAVGADAVIPDYREAIPLVDYLLGRAAP